MVVWSDVISCTILVRVACDVKVVWALELTGVQLLYVSHKPSVDQECFAVKFWVSASTTGIGFLGWSFGLYYNRSETFGCETCHSPILRRACPKKTLEIDDPRSQHV